MLRRRKVPKRKSIAKIFLRDVQGTATQKLALFEKLKTAGGLDGEDPEELRLAENMLRTFAAIETGMGVEKR